PTQTFADLAQQTLAPLATPSPDPTAVATLAGELARAYLVSWSDAIDTGIQHWAIFGLATTKALFDPGTSRFWQNDEGKPVGADVDPLRGAAEKGVKIKAVVTAELDDPNHDGQKDDSFITNYLLPMLGVPASLARFRSVLSESMALITDLVLGPVRGLLNPINQVIADAKQVVSEFVEQSIQARFGVDFDQFAKLSGLFNKMDVRSVDGVPIFGPGDHLKLDALMGIEGKTQSETLASS